MPVDSNELKITIVVAATVYLLLAGLILFVLFFYQRKKFQHKEELLQMQQQYNEALLQSQLETHEATLHQISEEIHDNIGQLLSSTKMLLGITERNLDCIPDTLRTAEQTLGKAIQDFAPCQNLSIRNGFTSSISLTISKLKLTASIHPALFTPNILLLLPICP